MIGLIIHQVKPVPQIGTLNRDYGYNGFEPIKKGAPIYGDESRCYFEMTFIADGSIHRQYFRTETLSPHIDFTHDHLK